jgi:hypothetical protein
MTLQRLNIFTHLFLAHLSLILVCRLYVHVSVYTFVPLFHFV